MRLSKVSEQINNISEYIAENFGANASYVEGLLSRFNSDPNSVDESWRTFFGELLSGVSPLERGNGQAATTAASPAVSTNETNGAAAPIIVDTPPAVKQQAAIALGADIEVKAITGVAKKIVENMEQSLTVPTATTFRNLPVKVLEENRRIINEHLSASGRGKVSFTHLIAWAIIKAIKFYPQMNVGYGLVNNTPSRLQHDSVNLGIAIDIEKKDGSRNLLVPNIKGSDKMNFA
ncbi:MAG: 2-oxo acid dehydrogenase subunit E2, partial [Actinomycetota bacterium]